MAPPTGESRDGGRGERLISSPQLTSQEPVGRMNSGWLVVVRQNVLPPSAVDQAVVSTLQAVNNQALKEEQKDQDQV